jgi:NADP-dependent 3-hydroxy acid dehydrogenase YdfG
MTGQRLDSGIWFGTTKEVCMATGQKVVVITGASQGIGAALVKAFRERNYRVVATARSIKPPDDTDLAVVPGDIADRKTAERAISEGVTRFGRIDTLVNNAGIFIAKPFTKYTEADYAAMLGVNLSGFFHITQLAVAEMEKQGSGHVVQLTTSLVGRPRQFSRTIGAGVADQGRPQCRDQIACDRICQTRHPGQRGLAGRHQVADASA